MRLDFEVKVITNGLRFRIGMSLAFGLIWARNLRDAVRLSTRTEFNRRGVRRQSASRLSLATFVGLIWCVGSAATAHAQCEIAKFQASDGAAKDRFGYSTGISGDYAVVGAYKADSGKGAAYIYERDGLLWNQIDRLLPTPELAIEDEYGRAVAISGSVAVVGARKHPAIQAAFADDGPGAVYVFRRNLQTGGWEYEQELTAADGSPDDRFGDSVAIEGDWIIVGAPDNDEFGLFKSGTVYAFHFEGLGWRQARKFRSDEPTAGDRFGNAVAISGNWVIVGSKQDDDTCPDGDEAANSGSVSTFFHDPAAAPNVGWEQRTVLQAQIVDGATVLCDVGFSANFGHAVAISGDRLVVGAVFDAEDGSHSGSAYVYRLEEPDWVIEQKLTASDGAALNNFGRSVAIHGDLVLVGASKGDLDDPTPIEDTGSVYLYRRAGTSWTEASELTASDAASSDRFGWYVSIGGEFAAIGAYRKNDSTGSAYIFAIVVESDCNKNGVLDDCEVFAEPSLDSNGNGVLDSCECAIDNDCIGALACLSGTCDQDTGLCVFAVNAGSCAIAGLCFDDGELNPANDCQLCEHAAGDSDWSNRDEGLSCGDSSASTCDHPDACDGEGLCHTNPESAGTACADDGNECTNDLCDGAGACGHPNIADLTPCRDDGNECTNDHCGGGVCSHPNVANLTPCTDDGNECTVNRCLSGQCAGLFQSDGTPCGNQSNTQCDSPDICDGAGNCLDNLRDDGTSCFHDGRFCTGEDSCQGGVCESAGDPCTADGLICDGFAEFWDKCSCDPAVEDVCSDGIFCNGLEICNFGACVLSGDPCGGSGLPCDEATDTCKCISDADCDDGDECTGVESCDAERICRHTLVFDCNANGLEDACDLDSENGESLDCNDDGVPDECEVDFDDDGFIDGCDGCLDSDLAKLIVVEECPTGVPNALLDDGCTMNDVLTECSAGAHSHGELTACVARQANEWRRQGLLSGKDVGRIAHCAGTVSEPRPSKRIKDVQSRGSR